MMKWCLLQLSAGDKHRDNGDNEADFLTPAAVLLILLTVIAVNHCSSSEAVGGNRATVITLDAEL